MRQAAFFGTIATAALLLAANAYAADPEAGKAIYSGTCAACHGANGISIAPIYPNVAGQKETYLVEQLKAFRDGKRENPIMSPMAKGLSDTDIANIAAYVSRLKP
ncbi:MAG TPA: cytochrome c [Nevskiaceae bacterium]